MTARDEELLRVHEIVGRGGRAEIVGSHGSGRTRLLERLCSEAAGEGWQVTHIRGAALLRDVPLSALLAAGLSAPPAGVSLAAAAASCLSELAKRSARSRHVIAVDDWEAVDQASQGVIEQASRLPDTALALTRCEAWIAGSSPSAVDRAFPGTPTLTVGLAPLRYDELQDVLRDRLGGDLDAATLSRIYAKSDGNIGLSIAMVEAGVRESRLVKRDALWTSTGEMWSPMLEAAIGRILAPLNGADREALELLSLTGVIDLEMAAEIIGAESIDRLEERRLIRVYSSARGYLVAVTPTLLAEHLRRTQPVARRVRLRSAIERALAGRDVAWLPPGEDLPFVESPAGFVSVIREQLHTRLLVTQAAWQHRRTADTAVPYLQALAANSAPPERIDRVLELSAAAEGSAENRAWLIAIAAAHRANVHHDVDEALADLRAAEAGAGEYAAFLRAWAVAIETVSRSVPPDVEQRLAADDESLDEPPSVAAARHYIAAFVATAMGWLGASERHLTRMRDALGGQLDDRGEVLRGLNLIGFGKLDRALELARRGVEDSRAMFDAEALRRYGYLAALCCMLRGDYGAFEAIAEEVIGLGEPRETPQVLQLAMLAMSVTVAQRQGKTKLARRYAAQLARTETPDGPFPGMIRNLGDVQALAGAGRPAAAADMAQQIADRHWGRGYRYQAAFGYALSTELDPTPRRFAEVEGRLGTVEGEYFEAQRAYLKALADREPAQLTAIADRLAAHGRPGQAIFALDRAAALFAERSDATAARRARQQADALIASNPPGSYDTDRYGGSPARLTAREREIVGLVARGLTNAEIAERLTLSIRTIESHINHIIAKSGISDREEFTGIATRFADS